MNGDRWQVLSDWYSTWRDAADGDERRRVQAEFAADHPDLAAAAANLAGAGDPPPGFLETPALMLAARDLADEDPLLAGGTQFGPYRIVGLLARGGMGDVYRATDVRLGRDVAIKTIAQDAAGSDPLRVDRFVQEARITAGLDHPNIIRVFDVGIANGRPYLVTELLDGETLRARISRLSMTPDDAHRLATAVANGLAAAHARGLVHRDLKPENIFLTKTGLVKILDFGIAKLAEDSTATAGFSTLTGVVLGTAGYLAPEQVTGGPLDARTDLFTLGSILFEAVTGRRAFARAHTIDTMHAIVYDQPADLGPAVPAELAAIVTRLLAKAPEDRFQSAAALLAALEETLELPIARTRSAGRRLRLRITRRQLNVILAAAGILLVGVLGWSLRGRLQPDISSPSLTRFTWSVPGGAELTSTPAVSPNGRQFAFTATDKTASRLYVRSLDAIDATAINGTEGAKQPFWSPRGDEIGFFAGGKLKKVTLAGGAPVEICDAPDGRGGAWSPSDVIVFGPNLIFAGLFKVPAGGGKPQPLTLLDPAQSDNSDRWPEFLPDGVHFLYWVRSSVDGRRGVFVGRIDQPASTPGPPLFASEAEAHFVPTIDRNHGVLISAAAGHVEARPFDAARLVVTGDPRVLPVTAAGNSPYDAAMVSVSRDLLVSVGEPISYGVRLGSVARDGRDPQLGERLVQNFARLSPTGDRLAHQIIDQVRGNPDIWVENLHEGGHFPVSTGPEVDIMPAWSPSGDRLAYVSGLGAKWTIKVAAADGTGVPDELPCPGAYCEPTDWTHDGKFLVVNTRSAQIASPEDVLLLSLDPRLASQPLLSTRFPQYDARLSSDGKAMAYVEDQGEGPQVWIQSLGTGGQRVLASAKGGTQPVWRHDDSEVFYVDREGRLNARVVRYDSSGTPVLGPNTLVNVPRIGAGHWGTQYDVTPDGRHIYYLDFSLLPKPKEMGVILGWRELLE